MTKTSTLIDQYFITLEAQFKDAISDPGLDPSKMEDLVAEIKSLLQRKNTTTWRDAYGAEQLIITILPQKRLDTELKRRLTLSDKMLDSQVVKAYREDLQEGTSSKRSLLASLTADLQWAYCLRTLRRKCLRSATLTGCGFFALTFLLFLLATLFSNLIIYILPAGNYMILYAILAGALGASYSTLTTVKSYPDNLPIEKIQTLCSLWYILSRILIGLCAALILFNFLVAKILQGPLLPNIEDISGLHLSMLHFKPATIVDKNFSLVIIYCFLAGFSEKLMPNLLSNMGEKLQGQEKS